MNFMFSWQERRLYVPRMATETSQNGVWACILLQIRLEHFEIISSLPISTKGAFL